ncbi:MAG: non-homologous end-joining DNA ligase [Nocardia sp.]|nr:non-homologous end-joining DNA ligase [Nocardia sp.]
MPARREVGGIEVGITNLDKVLYPATGTTKGQVIDYFTAIAPALLPHIADRPVTRKRWPNGVRETSFFEKNLASHAPTWIRRETQVHGSRPVTYPIIDSAAGVAWLGQQAALEIHVPQWRFVDRAPGPATRLVFDLDPGEGTGLAECARVALWIRETVRGVGLDAYPVTSGSKGIHLYVPLDRELGAAGASTVAKQLATGLARLHPELVTTTMAKAARPGRIFLDWSQNNPAKTTIAPYSLRGREHPTVAAPRTWTEIEDIDGLRHLNFEEVLERWHRDGDLLRDLDPPLPQRISPSPARTATPRTLSPMLATSGDVASLDARDWVFETKWDGFRILVSIDDDGVLVRSRAGNTVTERYSRLAALGRELAGHRVVLDGEAVVLDADGRSDLPLLQSHPERAILVAFDVLYLDGTSLLRKRFSDRRQILEVLAEQAPSLLVSPPLRGSGAQALAYSREHGLEGVVAKRKDSVYLPGRRGQAWVKTRNWRTLEVVIGGWRRSAAREFASLLVGVRDDGQVRYVGRVGTGFSDREMADLAARLRPLRRESSPFGNEMTAEEQHDAVWVAPEITGTVRYMNWTDSGRLWHPAWLPGRRGHSE